LECDEGPPPPRWQAPVLSSENEPGRRPASYVARWLGSQSQARGRLPYQRPGELVDQSPAPADRDGLYWLTRRVGAYDERVRGVVESMNGARFVHDELVAHGWEVLIADAQRVKGLAPLACKTDKVDSRVLAELSFRDLAPAIWLPDPQLRRERERSRFRTELNDYLTTRSVAEHISAVSLAVTLPGPEAEHELPREQQGDLESLVSTKTGKPIRMTTLPDPGGFGLGLGLGQQWSSTLGTAWLYEGETWAFRVFHIYLPRSGTIIALGLNSATANDKSRIGIRSDIDDDRRCPLSSRRRRRSSSHPRGQ
jgi:hypothetical protein